MAILSTVDLTEPLAKDTGFLDELERFRILTRHADKPLCLVMNDVEYPFFAGCFFIVFMEIVQLLKVELPADPNKHLGWYKEVSDKVSSVLPRLTQIREKARKGPHGKCRSRLRADGCCV